MNLEDALGGANNPTQGDPRWPGQPATHPTWPEGGGSSNPAWLSGGGGGNSNTNSFWPTNPQPPGPGGWSNPQPSAPGAWPGPQPPAPGPGGWHGPSPGPGPGPGPMPVSPQQNLAVPYKQDIPSGVYDKLLITIKGTVKQHADRFMVDLYTSTGDLAFHFNPRFNEDGRKVIVRNTCISNKWGKEERDLTHFPFVKGQPFEIKILCTNQLFKVAVNNAHLLEYRHRITDLRSIKRLNVFNDVTLSSVNVENLH